MTVKEMGLESVDEIILTQNRYNWRAVVKMAAWSATIDVFICRRSSSFGTRTHFLCTALQTLSWPLRSGLKAAWSVNFTEYC